MLCGTIGRPRRTRHLLLVRYLLAVALSVAAPRWMQEVRAQEPANRNDTKSGAGRDPEKQKLLRDAQNALFRRLVIDEAWKTTKGDPDIVIGVIDDGFDFFHPDLRGAVQPGYYYPGGYHCETYESIAHGTRVSSIIIAKDDDYGICGLAPNCKVITACQGTLEHKLRMLQLTFFEEHPTATRTEFQQEIAKHADELKAFGDEWVRYQVAGAADAIRYLVDRQVSVINISGFLSRQFCNDNAAWEKLERAFNYAASNDVVIVLAAGNTAMRTEDYPGSNENVLVVGACTNDGKRWVNEVAVGNTKTTQGSQYGSRLSVMAPVQNLAVCMPHDQSFYGHRNTPQGPSLSRFEGPHKIVSNGATSLAAPIVSSLAALVRSANPKLSAIETIGVINEGCNDLAEWGVDEYTGHGMVNFGRTMQLAIRKHAEQK